MKKRWQQAMESVLGMMTSKEAERFRRGLMAGGSSMGIEAAGENRSDYRDLLRSYTMLRERRLEDPEMIDTDWYTLGLELYGNVPIIEFPESSEAQVIDDMVQKTRSNG